MTFHRLPYFRFLDCHQGNLHVKKIKESFGMPFVPLDSTKARSRRGAGEKRERRSASLANREARRSFMGRM